MQVFVAKRVSLWQHKFMSTTIDAIFKPEELREARTVAFSEELKTLKVSSRRANEPAARVALAEIEQILRTKFVEMRAAGLVNDLPEGLAA